MQYASDNLIGFGIYHPTKEQINYAKSTKLPKAMLYSDKYHKDFKDFKEYGISVSDEEDYIDTLNKMIFQVI